MPQKTKRRARAPKNGGEAKREALLRKAYRDFIAGRGGKCDVAFAGEDTDDLSAVVLHCFTHDYTWSDSAASLNNPCPKSREFANTPE